jgi:WD40 repeat protein
MKLRPLLFALGITCVLVPSAHAADEPPLPKGAKLRLGDTRFHFRFSPYFHPNPPDFKTLVFHNGKDGLTLFDMETARRTGDEIDNRPTGPGRGDFILSGNGKRYAIVRFLSVTVHDIATGAEILKVQRTPTPGAQLAAGPLHVSLSANGKVLAWGGQDKDKQGEVTVWDVDTNQAILEVKSLQSAPAVPVLSPDGKLLAVRGYTLSVPTGPHGKAKVDDTARIVQVWDIAAKKEVFQAKLTPVSGAIPRITDSAFSPDGSLLAASFGNGVIDWWDVKTGKEKPPLLGRATQGHLLAFSPDGKTIASTGPDGAIQRWQTADGKPLPTTEIPDPIPPHFARGLRFIDNERLLSWGYISNTAVVWEAPSGKVLTQFPKHTATVRSIAFAKDGKEIITAGPDARTIRWDAQTGKPLGSVTVRPTRTGPSPRPVLTLSSDGTRATSIVFPAFFDLKTGIEEFSLPRGLNALDVVAATNHDLTRVVVVNGPFDRKTPTRCTVWDVAERRKVGEIDLGFNANTPPSIGISPSGNRLVVAYQQPLMPGEVAFDKLPPLKITGWDLKTGKKLGEIEDVNARGEPVVAVGSDSFAVVAAGNGRLRAYDYEIGRGGDEFEPPVKVANAFARRAVAFAPDSKRVAAAWFDEQGTSHGARVYEWPSGKVLHTFTGHIEPVATLRFSPDGKTLATGSDDTTVLLWDLTTIK